MGRRFLHAPARVLVVASVATGCSLFTSFGDFSDGDAASTADAAVSEDARADEGGVTPPATDAGADVDAAPPVQNLHPEGDFEIGCGRWTEYEATLADSDVARTGKGACLVCSETTSTDGVFTIDDGTLGGVPKLNKLYRAEAWVRGAPGRAKSPWVSINLRTMGPPPSFTTYEQTDGPLVPLTDDWTHLEIDLLISELGGKLNIYVAAQNGDNRCFLIDDVRLWIVE